MKSGRLRHRITVKARSTAQDEYGEQVELYSDLFHAMADVRVLSSQARLESGLSMNSEYKTLLMRYDARLKYEYYIESDGYIYSVISINPDNKKREMVVTIERDVT